MPSEPDPSFPKEVAIDAGGARAEAVPVTPTTTSSDSDSDTISDASSHYDPINTGEKETHRPIQRTISRASHGSGIGEYADITDGLRRQKTSASVATTGTTDPAFEIDFEEDDKKNPQAWPLWFKGCIIATMSYGTTTVVMYSTSYTAAIPGLQKSFGISDSVGILGVTTYLMGMAVGSVILAPLSEMYGRRPIYIIALGIFVLLLLPCALAPNIEAILVTRFFGAFAASAMISNAPGTVNDIVDETHRALAFSIWSIGPMNGPVIGPVVGGFVFQYLGWRVSCSNSCVGEWSLTE
ncbi:hypothetical protein M8818_004127 [Zalaria obscura]|uniref:Uncharacterized protein n=1 Tax=Zalaria obscura TaxID=2024903 RepID=A0ACC3SCW3_9PEZI